MINNDTMVERDSIQQYQTLNKELLEAKLKEIPQQLKDLIPTHLSLEDKLEWIKYAESKITHNGTNLSVYKIPRRPPGSGPFSGPGTAPGTGPGTEFMVTDYEYTPVMYSQPYDTSVVVDHSVSQASLEHATGHQIETDVIPQISVPANVDNGPLTELNTAQETKQNQSNKPIVYNRLKVESDIQLFIPVESSGNDR